MQKLLMKYFKVFFILNILSTFIWASRSRCFPTFLDLIGYSLTILFSAFFLAAAAALFPNLFYRKAALPFKKIHKIYILHTGVYSRFIYHCLRRIICYFHLPKDWSSSRGTCRDRPSKSLLVSYCLPFNPSGNPAI